MPLVLGVTGSIASGKSSLVQYLVKRHGAVAADIDRVVHRLYEPGMPAYGRVVEAFGSGVVGPDNFIDRKVLGAIIFAEPHRAPILREAIGDLGGEVKRIIDRWRVDLPQDQVAVFEAFNLVEGGYAAWCDATWLVAIEDHTALSRLMARNSLSEADARQRLASAWSWERRAPACDLTFHNDGAQKAFEAAIEVAIVELLRQHREGSLPTAKYHGWASARRRIP